jgi:glucose-6-phosphate 1-epimerase
LFEPGKAIRRGVPIIFPWFGPRGDDKPSPAHGFARSMEWAIEATKLRNDGKVEITLAFATREITRGFGYDAFQLRFRVTVGSELEMELETRNEANEPLVYEEALHTYFAIGDVHQASVSGLEGTTYIDKTDAFKRKTLGNEPVRIAKDRSGTLEHPGHLRYTRPGMKPPYLRRKKRLRQHCCLESVGRQDQGHVGHGPRRM